jgi:DNA-binding NarL/FixJ family response regulator
MTQYSIAILDAHPGAAFVTQRALEWELGSAAQIVLTTSPQATLELCGSRTVDLLVVDPPSYGEAGWALLEQLHEQLPGLRIIVLTATSTPLVRRRAEALGIVCLAKTEEMSQICTTARSLLETSFTAPNNGPSSLVVSDLPKAKSA